jgi:pseudouridine-5'-phosphate glycosidase
LSVSVRLDSPEEVVAFTKTHWELGFNSAVLVCQPIPVEDEIPRQEIEAAIRKARQDAHNKGIHGQFLTPYLLSRMAELTRGASLKANIKLLHNNARLAALIAKEFWKTRASKV